MGKGWECPRCGTCYSPTVQKCQRCKPHPSNLDLGGWTLRPVDFPYVVSTKETDQNTVRITFPKT